MMNETENSNNRLELEQIINSCPVPMLRKACKHILEEWADTDSKIRQTAKKVLTEEEVNGSEDKVPSLVEVVELLVNRITRKEKENDKEM